ncbi:LON peptidase substrate-binding domain-containing protein [Planctomycetes bacterium K23_9]|uniref:Lon protease n=1 Tax=Stieleria marina TaxID=1930275 RepID=A0A517NWL5_9BACT|nr:Lon protease [Planctomycetes bacterium K23_9]
MADIDAATRLPDDFDGRVRLFPLPETVLFPHAMQPLHIFEPRYCEMLADSLAGDQLIAMTTLTGGPTSIVDNQPPIASTVCIGKIISHVETDEQRHNILLVGSRRAKIIRELDTGRPFRMAEVDVQDDVYPPSGSEFRVALKSSLLETFGGIIPQSNTVQQNLCELMAGQMGLGPITDIIGYTLPFGIEQKLDLLAQPDVDQRAQTLIKLLKSGDIKLHSVSAEEQSLENVSEGEKRFPPPFSLN